MGEEESRKPVENKQKAVYACMVCKNMFSEPGMCPDCDQVLKKGAA